MTVISHYGTKRHSGRYPWGSGNRDSTLSKIEKLTAQGLSEVEIAAGFNMSTTELRSQKSLAKQAQKEDRRLKVTRMRDAGQSIASISRELKLPAQTIRDLLQKGANLKYRLTKGAADNLKALVDKHTFVDVGEGSEIFMNVSRTQMDNAVQLLVNEGYSVHTIKQEQLGSRGNKKTTIKVLTKPDTDWKTVLDNRYHIVVPNMEFDADHNLSLVPEAIKNISSDRVLVRYNTDGGAEKDGLIELRRGVDELNLGGKGYAQVRIGVDGTHFMKGMAVLRDDLPDGVDIIYNTKKDPSPNKLDAMKEQKVGDEAVISQFGAVITPNRYLDANGVEQIGMVNVVGDKKTATEGSWADWNKSLASQVLSKQSPRLAENQLAILRKNHEAELEEILSLTNPTVRNHILMEFSEKVDKASVDLKAAALPGQTTNVILPDPNMKPTEVYAPNYKNGEVLSLVRYPHGGIFEIPTLTVNNKKSEYRDIIGTDAQDAIALHPDVAAKLSGADFDGDFVLAIPNKRGVLKTAPSLEALKDFDPITAYPYFEGMQVMKEKSKGRYMGEISNLITDMTILGASEDEIARAVKHSMVVIDAPKHELNFKQSYDDNAISALKERYQIKPDGSSGGAATLISRAKSEERVPARLDRYSIDPKTGEKVYHYTDEVYIDKKGREIPRTIKSQKLAEHSPYSLTSNPETGGTLIEKVYADHSQALKDIANKARLATLEKADTPYSASAAKVYSAEVESLNRKYKQAVASRPMQRKAQLVAGEIYKTYSDAAPNMSYAEKRTAKARALRTAQTRLGAKKPVIDITPREWQAIEAGAITKTRLKDVLRNADMDLVRSYSTPRAAKATLTGGKKTRAQALLKSGYTTKEVADALGVPVNQVRDMDKN